MIEFFFFGLFNLVSVRYNIVQRLKGIFIVQSLILHSLKYFLYHSGHRHFDIIYTVNNVKRMS